MSVWGRNTPCVIEEHCFFHDYVGTTKKRCCRALTSKDGKPPYEAKCPFYKDNENDFSGGKYYGIERIRQSLSGKDKKQ